MGSRIMALMKWESPEARCSLFVFKEGALSGFGHDLHLRVEKFVINVADGRLHAAFDAGSVRVMCARANGEDRADALSARDIREIEATIRTEILQSDHHPQIVFSAPVPEVLMPPPRALRGELT